MALFWLSCVIVALYTLIYQDLDYKIYAAGRFEMPLGITNKCSHKKYTIFTEFLVTRL